MPLALGSDTGGSIRVPSAFCGTVGFKPTYGRISLTGAWPLAAQLDHPGPMARTPADAALFFRRSPATTRAIPRRSTWPSGMCDAALVAGLGGLRVGICPDLHQVPLAPDVPQRFDAPCTP